jgi:hypothetical protein
LISDDRTGNLNLAALPVLCQRHGETTWNSDECDLFCVLVKIYYVSSFGILKEE